MIVHFSAHISKWELVCKFGVIFHIFIISCLCSRFHVWNQWFFYSVITFSYTKCFVLSYTVDVVFILSYFMISKINSGLNVLTHWGQVTLKCTGDLIIIGSHNGLLPGRRQAIILTNAVILLIGPLGTNFSEILIIIPIFSFKKMRLTVSSGKWRPFCLRLNVLKQQPLCAYAHLHNPMPNHVSMEYLHRSSFFIHIESHFVPRKTAELGMSYMGASFCMNSWCAWSHLQCGDGWKQVWGWMLYLEAGSI